MSVKLGKIEVSEYLHQKYSLKPEITLSETIVTPTTEYQMIEADENTGFSKITVQPVSNTIDANIIASNIKEGVSILGVTGTLTEKTESDLILSSLTVDPDIDTQSYNAPTGYAFNTVTINPVTSDIDTNIKPENIKEGVSILGVTGTMSTSGSGSGSDNTLKKIVDRTITLINREDLEGITSIGSRAFYECLKLTSVTTADSITTIGNQAFAECLSLETATLTNVSSIDMYAFFYCRNLKTITLSANLSYIGPNCFNSTNITDVYFNGSLADWCNIEFDYSGIGSIAVKDGNSPILYGTALHIKNGNDYIKLEGAIEIPDTITTIKALTFQVLSDVTSITIPTSVNKIETMAFFKSKISDLYYTGTMTEFKKINLGDNGGTTWHTGSTFTVVHCSDGDYEI